MKSNSSIARAFAFKEQDCRSGHMIHEGDTIFSYGHHFPIARRNDDVVLLTGRRYSVTTSNHIGLVGFALYNSKDTVFVVDNVLAESEEEHADNIRLMLDDARELVEKSKRARKYSESYMREADARFETVNEYRRKFIPSLY